MKKGLHSQHSGITKDCRCDPSIKLSTLCDGMLNSTKKNHSSTSNTMVQTENKQSGHKEDEDNARTARQRMGKFTSTLDIFIVETITTTCCVGDSEVREVTNGSVREGQLIQG